MKIAVIGTGYVGLVSGTCLADLGHEVVCIDIDLNKIKGLKAGVMPIYEAGLEELVTKNVAAGRLSFSDQMIESLHWATAIFIAVGTPQNENGSADLKHVLTVAEEIGMNILDYKLVIVKSTVPVGTVHKVHNLIEQCITDRKVSVDFDVASNPEFLKEGVAIDDFMKPDRIVAGVENERAARYLEMIYAPLSRQGFPLILMDICSAEITKYAANSMLALRISFMNELACLCEKTGADVQQVRRGIGSDTRIGTKFLAAGLGYGGSCFPKDVLALINTMNENSLPCGILSSVNETNKLQRNKFIFKVSEYFKQNLLHKKIAVWGLSFKPGTDDVREAPSKTVIKELVDLGAQVHVYDPVAMNNFKLQYSIPNIHYYNDMYSAVEEADALLIMTEWDHFKMADLNRVASTLKHKAIFDGRNIYDPKTLAELGFYYFSFGRSPVALESIDFTHVTTANVPLGTHELSERVILQ